MGVTNILLSRYSNIYSEVPVDRTAIPQDLLNVRRKARVNPMPWHGQFTPELVETLIDYYAASDATVLDPFVGSGTTLLEAGKRGLAVMGVDINPAAYLMSRLYQFVNVCPADRIDHLCKAEERLSQAMGECEALLRIDQARDLRTSSQTPEFIVKLAAHTDDPNVQLLLQCLVSVAYSRASALQPEAIFQAWRKIKRLATHLPLSSQPVTAVHADARAVPLSGSEVDIVITSPPYINVFNYHQRSRAAMEVLSWNLLDIAQSELGANRKHRSNRFLTVIQYCIDMAQVLMELRRVSKREARLVFVVGRVSNVNRVPFFNGEILATLAMRCVGMTLVMRQERVFTNRFGKAIYEDILHFEVGDQDVREVTRKAREVARDVLVASQDYADHSTRQMISQALENLQLVEPSKLFDSRASIRGNDGRPNKACESVFARRLTNSSW